MWTGGRFRNHVVPVCCVNLSREQGHGGVREGNPRASVNALSHLRCLVRTASIKELWKISLLQWMDLAFLNSFEKLDGRRWQRPVAWKP
jgi:hypothetical protein